MATGQRLTPRRAQFIAEYLTNGMNGTQAVLKVYRCTYNAAKVTASRMLSNANVRSEIERLTQANHLTAAEALAVIKDALVATDVGGCPVWNTRLKGAEATLKLLGYL